MWIFKEKRFDRRTVKFTLRTRLVTFSHWLTILGKFLIEFIQRLFFRNSESESTRLKWNYRRVVVSSGTFCTNLQNCCRFCSSEENSCWNFAEFLQAKIWSIFCKVAAEIRQVLRDKTCRILNQANLAGNWPDPSHLVLIGKPQQPEKIFSIFQAGFLDPSFPLKLFYKGFSHRIVRSSLPKL